MTLPPEIENLEGLRRNGADWIACCPVHEDRSPSLSIRVADDGTVLAHCHAGCDQRDVAEALGLHRTSSTAEWTPRGDAIAIYHYVDEQGAPLFDVCRTADKQFPQRRPDPSARSGWRWSLGDTRRVLYRLPEVIAAVLDGATIYIAEGEKDVEALRGAGKVATCNPGGAGKWRAEYANFFTDAKVIICADKDRPGQSHARDVAASLQGIAAQVWVVEAADPHKDVAAHLGAGLALKDLATTHRPDQPARPDLAEDVHQFLERPDDDYDWLIEGFLERWERVVLTGGEGTGKSMLTRQIAVCMAAGLHPLTFTGHQPVTVLVIDCENSERQNRRRYRPMVQQAARDGHAVPDGGLRLMHRPNGLDLTNADDAAWLIERVTAHQPQVLVIGPLYQLHRQNMNDELAARQLTAALRLAQSAVGCALIIEAHAGHGDSTGRSMRPTGSSLFMRWPEYGIGLKPFRLPDGTATDPQTNSPIQLHHWRGARDERTWPRFVERAGGTGWAWREWMPPGDQRYSAPYVEEEAG